MRDTVPAGAEGRLPDHREPPLEADGEQRQRISRFLVEFNGIRVGLIIGGWRDSLYVLLHPETRAIFGGYDWLPQD